MRNISLARERQTRRQNEFSKRTSESKSVRLSVNMVQKCFLDVFMHFSGLCENYTILNYIVSFYCVNTLLAVLYPGSKVAEIHSILLEKSKETFKYRAYA